MNKIKYNYYNKKRHKAHKNIQFNYQNNALYDNFYKFNNFHNIDNLINNINNCTLINSKLGKNCIIENSVIKNCIILDNCIIKNSELNDCIIYNNCIISNSTIFNKVIIERETKITNSQIYNETHIGSNCTVGPFAHIHDFSDIGDNCRIGNYVEIKKSIVEEKTKIAHLSYIGDATIGKSVNVGAGVIFCNYDGKNKHKTNVGNNTFIGSNSILIAPITIGKNCKIGAGSCVTKDVDDNSFYLSRTKNVKYTQNNDIFLGD